MEAFMVAAISEYGPVVADFLYDDDTPRPPEEWIFGMSSLGIGPNVAVPRRPYIVYKEGFDTVHQAVRGTSNARNRNFQWYVYDHKGDFTRINRILNNLRDLAKGMAPFTTDDGVRCSDSLWLGISGQAVDDGYDSCVKYALVRFTTSQ